MAKEKINLSKSDRVRQYLAKKPTASVHQIVEDLAPYRISEALAGKIKYSERREAPTNKPAKPTAPAAGHTQAAGGTKADAIRAAAKSLPKPIRPRDVRAELAKQGIEASTTFIGKVLRAAGMKRKRGRKAAAGNSAPAVASNSLNINDLVAAKKLVGQVGSIEKVREALAALAKLG